MIVEYAPRFKRAYRKLGREEQRPIAEAIRRFLDDPGHPSLRVKKMQGMPNVWEARASDSLRITFQRDGERVILRNVRYPRSDAEAAVV